MKLQYRKAKCGWNILFRVVSLIILNALSVVVIFAGQSDIEERLKALTSQDMLALLRKAEAGNAESQYILGRAYQAGRPVARDSSEALKWYRKAAEQGYALAEFSLAAMYIDGEGVSKDSTEAVRWLRKAAEHGHAFAQFTFGYNVEQRGDFSEAAKWYRKAAEQGLVTAQNALGFMYEQGRGLKKDDKEAAKWYRKAAEQGDANAQSNLGNMYSAGKGVAQDYSEAAKWFRLSAEQGWTAGQANLAGLYMLGNGVPRDFVSAYMWCSLAAITGQEECRSGLQVLASQMKPEEINEAKRRVDAWSKEHQQYTKAQGDIYIKESKDVPESVKKIQTAAEGGDAEAQSVLGEMYYRASNYEEALKWFHKSAGQGYSYGQYNLGVMYLEGSGVAKNESEAVKWFTKAAEQWHIDAINNLIAAYFYGKGVPKDMIAAYMWIKISASAGDATSVKNLEAIKGMLTTEQLNEAERRATAWQAAHNRSPVRQYYM